jgi:hypothetical protein
MAGIPRFVLGRLSLAPLPADFTIALMGAAQNGIPRSAKAGDGPQCGGLKDWAPRCEFCGEIGPRPIHQPRRHADQLTEARQKASRNAALSGKVSKRVGISTKSLVGTTWEAKNVRRTVRVERDRTVLGQRHLEIIDLETRRKSSITATGLFRKFEQTESILVSAGSRQGGYVVQLGGKVQP